MLTTSEPFQWRSLTDDPNDAKVKSIFYNYLNDCRVVLPAIPHELLNFFVKVSSEKHVLDIGICEHTIDYINNENWKHRHIVNASKYCLGIDIIEPLVKALSDQGFNAKCVNALSDTDLGQRFETIICGDVIEHVDNPIKLLSFAKRHLKERGSIYISTPNPYCWYFIKRLFKMGTFVTNFEHTAWYTPSTIVELASRAGLTMKSYYVFAGSRNPLKRFIKNLVPAEMQSMTIIYELVEKQID